MTDSYFSGRLKSPFLGASRLVSACAEPFTGAGAERSAKADRWPAAQKGDFSHRL